MTVCQGLQKFISNSCVYKKLFSLLKSLSSNYTCIFLLLDMFVQDQHIPYFDADNINHLRAALYLEARPINLQADCTKFKPLLGWRPASSSHYNKIMKKKRF